MQTDQLFDSLDSISQQNTCVCFLVASDVLLLHSHKQDVG